MNWLLKMDAGKLWRLYWYPTYFFLISWLILFISWRFETPFSKTFLLIFVVLAIGYSVLIHSIWAMSLGKELFRKSSKLISNGKPEYYLYTFSYLLFLFLGIGFIVFIMSTHAKNIIGLTTFLILAIVLRSLIGFILAKRIVTIEKNRTVKFTEYRNLILYSLYFPNNIKAMHPRIQRLMIIE